MDQIEFLRNSLLFKGFDENAIMRFAEQMEEIEFESGGVIFSEKSPADSLYIIKEGEVNIYVTDEHSKEFLIGRLIQHEAFGQLSLLGNFERIVKAVATNNTVLLRLSRQKFVEMNKGNAQLSLRFVLNIFTDFIKTVQDNKDAFRFVIGYYINNTLNKE